MNEDNHLVIIGGGIAGVFASSHLRRNNFQGEITIVDQQKDLPYDRPPLTKEFLRGQMAEEEILLRSPDYYEDSDVRLKLGHRAADIDPRKKTITLENGEIINWNKLLITTGSTLNQLKSIDQHRFENVFYIRTKEDSIRFKKEFANLDHIAIIGGGFIGLEVAASLRSLGKEVTLLVRSKTPLKHVLGKDMGEYLATYHRSQGVNIITEDYGEKFNGHDGRINEIITHKGNKILCDAIVVSIGVKPNLSLVENILECKDSRIIVNQYSETSVQDIYAAGDCVCFPDPTSDELIHIEHWEHAYHQGRNAAMNILKAKSVSYEEIPYFWSDQYSLNIEFVGHPLQWDQTIIRGNLNKNEFITFYIHNQMIVGALHVNRPKDVSSVRKMIGRTLSGFKHNLKDVTVALNYIV